MFKKTIFANIITFRGSNKFSEGINFFGKNVGNEELMCVFIFKQDADRTSLFVLKFVVFVCLFHLRVR